MVGILLGLLAVALVTVLVGTFRGKAPDDETLQ